MFGNGMSGYDYIERHLGYDMSLTVHRLNFIRYLMILEC